MTETDLTAELDALTELSVDALVTRYFQLYGKEPRSKHRTTLLRRCAWKLQEQRLGGLSGLARARLDELMAEIDVGTAVRKNQRLRGHLRLERAPSVGTVFTRKWRDREIEVRVVEEGFEWEAKRFRSLSAVARAVTGQHVSGPAFFGLTKRKRAL